ncbi:MAG TPA: efflux RND transporter periplasmic adaptor subunit [Terriglobales bacterium]|nr:efflux RND transporter periplasmic adaptor subunit [Terriglobales bacterium]
MKENGMKPGAIRRRVTISALLIAGLLSVSCSDSAKPEATKAEITVDPNVYNVDHPELFKLAKAETRDLPTVLTANGVVTPDVNSTIHVTSLGSGRIVDLKVRLGDYVRKGQSLLVISSPDLAAAMADYQKARADEELSRKALERAQLLYSRGALAQKDLEVAQDTEDKAKVDLQAAEQHVRVLGGDPAHPGPLIDLRAPVSGTIVEQNVAGFEGVKSLDNTPNLFTIANLAQVWVVCDVFENDLGKVHLGDSAEIHLNAYPGRTFNGTVGNISSVLDPNTRSAKVRVVLANPDGALRPGMFAVATFRSRKLEPRTVVPATAVLRLQDKDWVFLKEGPRQFRRVEIHVLPGAPDGMQQIQDGLRTGDGIIANALEFSSAVAERKE